MDKGLPLRPTPTQLPAPPPEPATGTATPIDNPTATANRLFPLNPPHFQPTASTGSLNVPVLQPPPAYRNGDAHAMQTLAASTVTASGTARSCHGIIDSSISLRYLPLPKLAFSLPSAVLTTRPFSQAVTQAFIWHLRFFFAGNEPRPSARPVFRCPKIV